MVDLSSVARATVCESAQVSKGERVWVQGWDHTARLTSHLALESRKRGAEVLLSVQSEDLWLESITKAPLDSLRTLSSYQSAALEKTDVFIFTLGPRRPVLWEKIPEERRKEVSVWLDTRYDRSSFAAEWSAIARRRGTKMLGLEATLATPERARAAGLNYKRWRDIMYSGCLERPSFISARARRLVPLLRGDGYVHISSPSGTKLTFRLDTRRVEVADGLATEERAKEGLVTFLPAGGIEVTMDEESAKGMVVLDQPTRIFGKVLRKLKLEVLGGRIESYTTTGPGKRFQTYLDSDENSGRLSFFGFGLNGRMRFGYTQDDKVLGGVEIGFGDNERKGGKNRANGNEWWGAISQANVEIGGKTIMRKGALKLGRD